ncbi:EscU/YscU/HrcU family type III secretion system export apparatus switch protein, partial [Paraburkholderia sp. BR14261]
MSAMRPSRAATPAPISMMTQVPKADVVVTNPTHFA